MATSSWLPAGAEESDDEDDYLYYDDYDKQNHSNLPEKVEPVATASDDKQELKPKRNSLIEINGSTDGFLLDDVRMAAINGRLDQLRDIIENQSKGMFYVDWVFNAGWTALMYSSKCGHKHVVHYLLERGSDPNYHYNMFTPLMATIAGTGPEVDLIHCAKHLIQFGANINAVDNYGNSPLIYAAQLGKSGLTELLISNGADINRPNNEGWNALHYAVREGFGKVIQMLLSNGIDVTSKTNSSQSAADIALQKGHQKISDILVDINLDGNSDVNNELINEKNHRIRRLSEVEVAQLNSYVKPLLVIKCREKSERKPKVPNIVELANFLSQTNYEHLLPEFEKNNFGYQDLVVNTEDTLRQIGVNDSATIRKISAHIILLHKQDWKKDCLKDLELDTDISCPEIYCILSNISNHLTRINQTIAFLNNKVKESQQILSHNTDVTPMSRVFNETLQSIINTQHLYNDLQKLRQRIESIEDFSEPQRPELMSIPFTLEEELEVDFKKSSKLSKGLIFSLVSVSALTVIALKYGNINKENLLTLLIQSIPRPKFPKFNSILITL